MLSGRHRGWVQLALALAFCSSALASHSAAGVFGSDYVARGMCGPYPRAQVKTAPGHCVGIVAGPEQGLLWPRNILEIGPGRFIVADAAGWFARGKARVLSLTIDSAGRARIETLISGRSLTHGLALGPDGRVYVGDDTEIWRFDPRAARPEPETLVSGLPGKLSRGGDHWHPMKQLVFDRDGGLIVNFGAPRDDCGRGAGVREAFSYPCPLSDGDTPDAALWRLEIDRATGKPGAFKPMARGLRNSMALAVHASGLILQAENNFDRWGGRMDPAFPPEEINVVVAGRHFGWPYCAGASRPVPEYRRSGKPNCARFEAPFALLPAHSAPLAMSYYAGPMFPELQRKLVIAFHGLERNGHRLVAYEVDAKGLPKGMSAAGYGKEAEVLIDGWVNRRGVGPTGRPSGMTIARDGSIWLVDDKARTVLVLLRAEARAPQLTVPEQEDAPPAALAPPAGWSALHQRVLLTRCSGCHAAFAGRDPAAAWARAVAAGLVAADNVRGSALVRAMTGDGGFRPMPPGGASEKDLAALRDFLGGLEH